MAEKRTRRLYVATRSFLIDAYLSVRVGDVAEEGAPILARRPDAFRPLVPTFPASVPAPAPASSPEPEPAPESSP